jgi:hypothetical protein
MPCARVHRAAARPPQKPGLRPIEQRTHHTHHTAVRCGEAVRHRCNMQHTPMQHVNAHRCNMQHTPMQHVNTHRCNAPRAPMHYATCDTHRCNTTTRTDATRHARRCIMQHATRTDAPCKRAPAQHATCDTHRCIDATCTDVTCNMRHAPMQRATRSDETCNAPGCDMLMQHTKRCIAPMQRAPMQHATHAGATCTSHTAPAHPAPHAPWQHRAATWLRHMVCLDACILPLGNLATQCMTSAGASCSARRARAPLCSTPRPDGAAPSPTIRNEYSHPPLRPRAVRRTPLAAACVRRTVRAIHRPCRAAQHTIPRRGTRNLRWLHAPPCCLRSSRP